jgi:hypothetical protein
MQGGAGEIGMARPPAHRGEGPPWAIALNQTASSNDVRVTLLALTVVADVIRISGIIEHARRTDVHLAGVPALVLVTVDGTPLNLIRAHVLPNERLVWASWTYPRPAHVRTAYSGRIDQIDLAYGASRVARETVIGPWLFVFGVAND